MRPWCLLQALDGRAATHAGHDAAGSRLGVASADEAACEEVSGVADARASGGDRRDREAEPLAIAESTDARLVESDPGIVVDGRASPGLGRQVDGIDRAMRAGDHDRTLGFGRQLGGAVDREDGDVHGAAVYIAAMVDNNVAVLILQHPQEQDRVLGTAKLICSTLANAK